MRIQQTHAYSAVNQQWQQLAFSAKVVDSGHTMRVFDVQHQASAVVDEPADRPVDVSMQQLPAVEPVDVDIQHQPSAVPRKTLLRNNVAVKKRIRQTVVEQHCSTFDDSSGSSDEYLPRALCGVPGCTEDIFMACDVCPSYLCYDHLTTSCAEHVKRTMADEPILSSSTESEVEEGRSQKRKRVSQKNLARCNRSQPEKWQKNKRKRARLFGKEYVNTAGNSVRAKTVLPCTCSHGRQKVFRCEEFTDGDRKGLHSAFYGTGDYNRQRDFIFNHVRKYAGNTQNSRKHVALQFTLPQRPGQTTKRVC